MQFQQLLRQSLIWRGFYFVTVLLLNVVFSRVLHADGSGWVYFLTNVFAFILLVGSLNIESGIAFYAAKKQLPKQTLLSFIVMAFAIIIIGLVTPLLWLYFHFYPIQNVGNKLALLYGVLYIGGILLCNITASLFQADNDFFSGNFCLGCINILLMITIILENILRLPAATIINTYFIFFMVQGVACLLWFFIKQNLSFAISLPNKMQLQLLLRYSLVALVGNAIFFFVYRIDYWFVYRSCSTSNLGNYIQASKTGQLLLIVPQILASVVFPKTASGFDKGIIKQNILIISRLLMQFFLLLMVVFSLVGKPIFTLAFGNTFSAMYLPFLLLLPGILSLSILALLSAYFSGINKVKINITGACLALVFVTLGNYFFIEKYGIVGAAIISSIGYTINLCYSFIIFFKDGYSQFFSLFKWQLADYKWLRTVFTNKAN